MADQHGHATKTSSEGAAHDHAVEHDHDHGTHDHSAEAHGAADAHAGHAEAGHAEAHAHEGHDAHGHHGVELGRYIKHPPEPPHLIQILYKMEQKKLIKEYQAANPGAEAPSVIEEWLAKDPVTGELKPVEGKSPTLYQTLHAGTLQKPLPLIGYAPWENHVFFGLAAIILIAIFWFGTAPIRSNRRQAMKQPSRIQALIEMIVGGFDEFCKGVLGEQNGRFYMPFIATLFSVILINNFMGLIPIMRAPTSSLVITFSLALCSFIVVQSTAWIRLGPLTYVHHLMGSPKDAIGWLLSPLFLILECISDFVAKPMSLALRLMGNILGKDILLGAFLGMGIALTGLVSKSLGDVIGVPLTIPFYFLGILLSTIQALVFSLLTMIYIMMVLPHDHDHDHDHEHGAEAHHDHGHAAHPKRVVHEAVPT